MAATPVRFSAALRRKQILEVAMRLFARQGFQGTTTRQIAEAAHVNEAIIFRHFPTKDGLYWAVIEHKIEGGNGRERLRDKLRRDAGHPEIFSSIAEQILERQAKDTTMSRLLLFSGLENHRLSQRFFRTYVAGYYEILADHIRERVRSGEFRDVDPLLAARGFLGMVVYHSWVQELFGGKRYQKFDNQKVSRTLADIWLAGMLQRTPAQKRARSPQNGSEPTIRNNGANVRE
jgi:TetR/AcrR family transcriptional regulator